MTPPESNPPHPANPSADAEALLVRIQDLVEALVTSNEQLFISNERLATRNAELEARHAQRGARIAELERETTTLRAHVNELTTNLSAAQATHHTLTSDPPRDRPTPGAGADPDHHRLMRLRVELDAYLGEIDRRLQGSPPNPAPAD